MEAVGPRPSALGQVLGLTGRAFSVSHSWKWGFLIPGFSSRSHLLGPNTCQYKQGMQGSQ